MAYEVNFTNGSVAAVVEDGTIDQIYSVKLVGKNVTTYGEVFAENYIRLLENGSNVTAPTNPVAGELWFNSSNATINNIGPSTLGVYDGLAFNPLGGSFASATQPSSPNVGDLWFDTTNDQLRVYSGASFILVGPGFTEPNGVSGAIVETVTDVLTNDHLIVKLYVSVPATEPGGGPTASEVVATVSQDALYTLNTASLFDGFVTIAPGIQLTNSGVIGAQFHGDATTVDGFSATDFLSSIANDNTLGTLSVLNDAGLFVGVSSDFKVSVTGNDVTVENQTATGDLKFAVDSGTVLTIDDANTEAVLNADPTSALGVATKQYVDAVATGSGAGLALKLNLSGGTMSGAIAMGTNLITGITNPVSAQDASTKLYTDTAEANAISTSNTYTDGLVTTLKGTASAAFDTLGEIETEIGNLSTSSTAGLALKVAKAGDTMTGSLILNADPSHVFGAATKQYVDAVTISSTAGIALKVAKAGDTMTGTLVLNADPINSLEAATKSYADDRESGAVTTSSADATAKDALIIGTATAGYDTLGEIETKIIALTSGTSGSLATKVEKTGDTMSGVLNMGTNKITSLATPTASTDAANKAYVDAITPSASSNGFGTRTVSTSAPAGTGSDGDIHYQI